MLERKQERDTVDTDVRGEAGWGYSSDVNEASWAWGQGQKEWGRGPKIFSEAEATMYEAEARHVREQLCVYEHED